jgi:acyl carrier protein
MTAPPTSSAKTSASEVLEHVRQTIATLFELELSDIRPDSTVFEELDLDSIDAIDLVAKLQQFTGERIDEQAMRGVRTVGDLAAIVSAQLERSGSTGTAAS